MCKKKMKTQVYILFVAKRRRKLVRPQFSMTFIFTRFGFLIYKKECIIFGSVDEKSTYNLH